MQNRKPLSLYLLYIVLIFLVASGVFGGLNLMLDPTGEKMEMPLKLLKGSPFNNYLVPGLLLLFFNGILPLTTLIGMWFKPEWHLTQVLNNIYRNRHWSWTFSLYNGIILILWVDLQIMMIGYSHFIQSLYALIGVFIIVLTLLPGVMGHFVKAYTDNNNP